MDSNKTNNLINFGKNDPEALARTVGLEVFEPNNDVSVDGEAERDRTFSKPTKIAIGLATAAVLLWAFAPRADHDPMPVAPDFDELAAQNAQVSYNPRIDDLLISGLRVKPNDTAKRTPSEAVLGNPRVQDYIAHNPDESSSLTTSALSLPTANSYNVVGRDIDGDGDKDTIAVPGK